jgi:hypothetical protein
MKLWCYMAIQRAVGFVAAYRQNHNFMTWKWPAVIGRPESRWRSAYGNPLAEERRQTSDGT